MTPERQSDAVLPGPQPDQASAEYWRALDEGRLLFQRCDDCGEAWLPARAECPHCLGRRKRWETASGKARLVSWVVYHHGYHDYFAARLPYNVAVVELAEGPRLISNVVAAQRHLRIDMPLRLTIQREAGVALDRKP